jgi:hypothetical protein
MYCQFIVAAYQDCDVSFQIVMQAPDASLSVKRCSSVFRDTIYGNSLTIYVEMVTGITADHFEVPLTKGKSALGLFYFHITVGVSV